MKSIQRQRTQLSTFFLGAALLGLGSSQAQGFYGYGFGLGGFNYVPSPTDIVNAHSLSGARAARPPSNNVYAGNPNSYLNRVRDNGFVPSYDVTRRVPPANRPDTRVSPGERPPVQQAPPTASPPPKPVLPLPSFFNDARILVWPSDAPVGGELQQKRDVSDESSRVVLGEFQAQGYATIGSVTDSRLKLVAYGQPALQYMRTNSTPRLADAFHMFMLALYESLGQAGVPPGTPSAGTR
jgi:hypothetical protein